MSESRAARVVFSLTELKSFQGGEGWGLNDLWEDETGAQGTETKNKTTTTKLDDELHTHMSDDNREMSAMTGTLLYVSGSCERPSQLTEEMYIPLVHVNVLLNLQKRCKSLWFM